MTQQNVKSRLFTAVHDHLMGRNNHGPLALGGVNDSLSVSQIPDTRGDPPHVSVCPLPAQSFVHNCQTHWTTKSA